MRSSNAKAERPCGHQEGENTRLTEWSRNHIIWRE